MHSDPFESCIPPQWLRPRFSSARVAALMTTRHGGVSPPPFDSFNPRPGIGDDPQAVLLNRQRMQAWIGRPPILLNQVHGNDLLDLDAAVADFRPRPGALAGDADASLTRRTDIACEIQVADCLPVLVADPQGRVAAAAHAGWRGLAAGVVEKTVLAAAQAAGVAPQSMEVWLGPCIGPQCFEVGADVQQALSRHSEQAPACFAQLPEPGKWLADLASLARLRLQAMGVTAISGNDSSSMWCTYTQAQQFFSYRRDRQCGRMSALIWLRHPDDEGCSASSLAAS
jgi:YfiH family protein